MAKTAPFYELAAIVRRAYSTRSNAPIESVTRDALDDERGRMIIYRMAVPDQSVAATRHNAEQLERVRRFWREDAPELTHLIDVCESVLRRLDMEPTQSIFPCSAMRETIRGALADVGRCVQKPD